MTVYHLAEIICRVWTATVRVNTLAPDVLRLNNALWRASWQLR